jgi:glyoxylase-like metal-dependent hydrolase (beta-lactamase superfamily II)
MLKIHQIVTAELEAPLSVSLFNSGASPELPRESVLPYGFRSDITRRDGTVVSGVMCPAPVWLIEGSDKVVLVDTGVGDIEEVLTVFERYGDGLAVTRSPDQDLMARLADHGLTPADIDLIVLTHLHFDHIGMNEHFPNARFVVQRDEILNGLFPPKFGGYYYPEFRHHLLSVLDRIELIDGDHQLVPGIRLLKIGGHTPGCQSVLVDTSMGRVCLASDIMYNYRNLELDWPTGSFWDLAALMRGYRRIRSEADIVVPGHDWEFRQRYPEGIIG